MSRFSISIERRRESEKRWGDLPPPPWIFRVICRIGTLHGTLPTIRQFIWIWKRSSASLRIWCLEFYLPLYSMDLLCLSLLLPAVLFNPLFLPFPSHSARPLALATRIALPGISEVLSRIQRLHRPSWMDRQSSLTPPRRSSLSLSLPPVLTPLACSLLLRLCSRRSFSLRVYPTTRCEIILRLDISRKIHEIRCVWLAVYTWYSKFSSLSPPPPPQFFAESLPKESLRSQGARSSCLSLYIFYKYR